MHARARPLLLSETLVRFVSPCFSPLAFYLLSLLYFLLFTRLSATLLYDYLEFPVCPHCHCIFRYSLFAFLSFFPPRQSRSRHMVHYFIPFFFHFFFFFLFLFRPSQPFSSLAPRRHALVYVYKRILLPTNVMNTLFFKLPFDFYRPLSLSSLFSLNALKICIPSLVRDSLNLSRSPFPIGRETFFNEFFFSIILCNYNQLIN